MTHSPDRLGIVAIAKKVRKDIRQAVKDGSLPKVKVTVSTNCSRGIVVTIREVEGSCLNPAWVAAYEENKRIGYYRASQHVPRYSQNLMDARDILRDIVNESQVFRRCKDDFPVKILVDEKLEDREMVEYMKQIAEKRVRKIRTRYLYNIA